MLEYFSPLKWGRWLGQFIVVWGASIPWHDAPKAIPAIILMMVLLVTSVAAWNHSSDWRTTIVDNQLKVAWDRDDFETAELVILRQLKDRPEDSKLLYRLGLSRDFKGEHDQATELMRTLVFAKHHEEAARWLLQKEYLNKNWADFDEEQKDEFGHLLAVITKEAPKDTRVKLLYADYLIATERYPQAIPLLDELSRVQPMRGLQAAALSRQLGNDATADRLAQRTLDRVSRMLEEDPTNADLAIAVAQNQLFLQQHLEAVTTLDRAVRRAKTTEDRQRLRLATGDAIAAWVTSIEQTPSIKRDDRLRVMRMLQTALAYAPNNPRVLALVADQALAAMEEEDEQVAALREALINGSSVGIAHFIRGTAALMKDDVETATTSLKLAAQHMPHSGAILNNLAVALAADGEEHLEQALRVSQSAIEQTPAPSPQYYETRGQILFQLGRHLDAISDLERALAIPSLGAKTHRSLAACYEKIGEEELARLHREAIEKSPEGVAEPE